MSEWFYTNDLEVVELIKNLDTSKSSIDSVMFKDCLMASIDKIVHLFNLIIRTSFFPNAWKIATITLLFKTVNIKDVSNYRPISLLSIISKSMEKIIHKRLYDHFREIKFLAEEQNGFRPQHSTTDRYKLGFKSYLLCL